MYQGLLKRAESTIGSVLAKYLGRALVAVPLLVAAGFATAALTVKAVEVYGAVTACTMMAALFAVIGFVTMAIVGIEQRPAAEPAAEDQAASAADSPAPDDELDPISLLTPELRTVLTSMAPVAIPGIARGVGRNLPLIFALALLAFIISRFGEIDADAAAASEESDIDQANLDAAAAA
ncbi:MAG: hypothetical protein AB7S70_09015 [Hyphomicrobium sp.]|uniref:hypothetical protein n=1 Tax=Hyphomicrobium sp. TaxID=82 RepID=UPI003D0B4E07